MKYPALILVITLLAFRSEGQVSKQDPLYIAMLTQDSIFFERAFNKCDLEYLEKTIHKDFTFYHDQGGYQDRKLFLERVKSNICGNPDDRPIRKLVPGSLEVFPLYNNGELYGAIQAGIHQFYRTEKGKPERLTSVAKFTHVYILQEGKWILREGLSYDHKDH